jgi:hypothetical protein
MFGNLQEQGDHPNSFDFFSGFQDDTEFVPVADFLGPDSMLILVTGMHLISIPLVLGHLNTTMFHVSFLLSVGEADLERSDGRIDYLTREHKKSCWYRYFTRPGLQREITHELSNSDRYGEI